MTEFELIAGITEGLPKGGMDLRAGVGDDCAIVAGPEGKDWLITTDALLEGVHFQRSWSDLPTLGRKALSVNLSDIAAMGGVPRFYLVSMGLPPDLQGEEALKLASGMQSVAAASKVILIGGDTTASASGLALSLCVIGEVATGAALLRSGAAAGDVLYVTGTLGGAALGLQCLRRGLQQEMAQPFRERQLDPVARGEVSRVLLRTGMLSSMIDVSDGLLADLTHVADASDVGFLLEAERVPRDDHFHVLAEQLHLDPVELALTGGEDYELLFTVKQGAVEAFEREVLPHAGHHRITRIGSISGDAKVRTIVDAGGLKLSFASAGFDHFSRSGE